MKVKMAEDNLGCDDFAVIVGQSVEEFFVSMNDLHRHGFHLEDSSECDSFRFSFLVLPHESQKAVARQSSSRREYESSGHK